MSLAQQQLVNIEAIRFRKHINRKNHNQYFTPEFAVEKALSLVPEIKPENIIDPAVGKGIFLKIASKKWQQTRLKVTLKKLFLRTLMGKTARWR